MNQELSHLFYAPKFGFVKGEGTCVALHHDDAEEFTKGRGRGNGVRQDVVGRRVLIGCLWASRTGSEMLNLCPRVTQTPQLTVNKL